MSKYKKEYAGFKKVYRPDLEPKVETVNIDKGLRRSQIILFVSTTITQIMVFLLLIRDHH